MGKPIWAVVDIETTGLNANTEIPLELGIRLIDAQGEDYGSATWLIYEDTQDWAIKMAMGAAHPIVGPMHQASGLWDDLVDHRDDALTREQVDEGLVGFLKEFGGEGLPMMGNSTGSLDRPFSLIHFPKFNETLGYRNIDVSTVKELCKANNAPLFENLLPIIGTKADATHRVMDDIDACIKEYLAYRENFFLPEE